MTVKIIESGAEVSFSESYACRLIEQGKAVPAPEKKKKTQKNLIKRTRKSMRQMRMALE